MSSHTESSHSHTGSHESYWVETGFSIVKLLLNQKQIRKRRNRYSTRLWLWLRQSINSESDNVANMTKKPSLPWESKLQIWILLGILHYIVIKNLQRPMWYHLLREMPLATQQWSHSSSPFASDLLFRFLLPPFSGFSGCFSLTRLLGAAFGSAPSSSFPFLLPLPRLPASLPGLPKYSFIRDPNLGEASAKSERVMPRVDPKYCKDLGKTVPMLAACFLLRKQSAVNMTTQSDGNFVTHILWASKLADRDLSMVEPGQDIYRQIWPMAMRKIRKVDRTETKMPVTISSCILDSVTFCVLSFLWKIWSNVHLIASKETEKVNGPFETVVDSDSC